jgi:putative membrane protein
MWGWHEGMGWWMTFGGILFVIFWGAVIALFVWGFRKTTDKGNSVESKKPLNIAKERYAKGEISKEEFDKIKQGLS